MKKFFAAWLLLFSALAFAQSSKYPPSGGGGGSGTVTSVRLTVPSFLSVSGSPITTSGTLGVTLSGTALPVLNGGTGATTASGARTALGTAASGANADITSLSNIGQTGVVWGDAGGGTPNTATIVAPATITGSYQLAWPTAQGGANQPLVNNGTGQLGWGTSTTSFVTLTTMNNAFSNIASKQIPALACDSNMALTGDGTCDGVLLSLLTYPQVLLVAQTDATENGIWCTAPGAWGRCGGMPDDTYTASGALVTVATGGGTNYDNTLWYINGVGDGTLNAYQVPVTTSIRRPYTTAGSCVVASTTLSTTATNETCTGVPASTAVAVQCSGEAAMSTPTGGAVYCRATGSANQIACNTVVANTTAMAFACTWTRP